MLFCGFFLMNFAEDLKKILIVNTLQAFALSRDVFSLDNEWLTREITDAEVLQAVKQIGPLKAAVPDGMQAIFTENAGISSIRIFIIWLELSFIMGTLLKNLIILTLL